MTAIAAKSWIILGLSVFLGGCGGGRDVTVRNGPQAVHPSPSALAQGGLIGAGPASKAVSYAKVNPAPTAVAPQLANADTEARQLFETYCTPGVNNNTRVTAVVNSGMFGRQQLGKLPVPGFEEQVFAYYKSRSGNAQIGFTSRSATKNYCVTVDGTQTGKEFYVTGP